MPRLKLTEAEKAHIRKRQSKNISGWGTKLCNPSLITEQDSEGLEIGDVVDGKVFMGMKTKNLKKNYNEIGMYAVNKDDPSKFLKQFVDGIVATIDSDADMKLALEKGELQLATANIRSGASNWYKTPLQPEVDNDYKSNPNLNYYTNPNVFPDGYGSLSDNTTDNWKANKALAQRRSTKFLAALKTALIAKGVKIFPAIKETVTSSIVSTGGLTDEKCKRDPNCSKSFKNPGQFVDTTLDFAYTSEKSEFGDFEECTNNLQITCGYYVTAALAKGRPLSGYHVKQAVSSFNNGRASTAYHKCDRAKFAFFLNDVPVGKVNLNNLEDGLSRKGTFAVTQEQLQKIVANTGEGSKWEPGELTLQIKGLSSDPHSEVPFITMVNGKGETLLDAEASKVKSYKGCRSYKQKCALFGPFNPCEPVATT